MMWLLLTSQAFAQSAEPTISTGVSIVSGLIALASLAFTIWKFSSDKSDKKIEMIELSNQNSASALRSMETTITDLKQRVSELERRVSSQEQMGAHMAGANLSHRIAELEGASKNHEVHLATVKTELRSLVDIAQKTSHLVSDLNRLLLEGS